MREIENAELGYFLFKKIATYPPPPHHSPLN